MMGSACSMQRAHEDSAPYRRGRAWNERQLNSSSDGHKHHNSLRHSVDQPILDRSFASLYPVEDNSVLNPNDGTRTPKTLAQLAMEELCRSLAHLDGSLPEGLPPDVIEDIVNSLHERGAWNATALAALRKCELYRLDLTRAKGATDDWIHALTSKEEVKRVSSLPSIFVQRDRDGRDMDLDMEEHTSSHMDLEDCSIDSFASAASTPHDTRFDQRMATPPLPETSIAKDGEDFTPLNTDMDFKPMAEFSPYDVDNQVDTRPVATRFITFLDLSGSIHLTDTALLKIDHLDCVEEARFDDCHAITGTGLRILSMSQHLHTLSFENCRRLTDTGILHLSHLMGLESLNLSGCRCLTDRSLAALADMYSLRILDMSQCNLLTNTGIEQLASLEHLEEINLGWCHQISTRGVKELALQPGRSTVLRRLCLARCPITDGAGEAFSRLKALEELNLNGCSNLSSTALGSALETLPRLQVLDVSHCRGVLKAGWQGKINQVKSLILSYSFVRDSHLTRLSSLPMLEELSLDSCPVGDGALSHLVRQQVVPNLTSLDMADTSLSDAGMVHIAKLSKLKRLSLFYCPISNHGLRHVANLRQLEVLNLDSRDISDEGLRYLRNLPLKSLDIFSGRITDSGCVHISHIHTLESLELCGGAVSDPGCVALAGLSSLRHLNLSQNESITNQGAAALAAGLVELRTLNLSSTAIDSEALRFFTNLTNLESLTVYGCGNMDYEARLAWLKKSLPSLRCLRVNDTPESEGKFVVVTSDELRSDGEAWSGQTHASLDELDAYSHYD